MRLIEQVVPWGEHARTRETHFSKVDGLLVRTNADNFYCRLSFRWGRRLRGMWFVNIRIGSEKILEIRPDTSPAENIVTVFLSCHFVQQVTHWMLSGHVEELPQDSGSRNHDMLSLIR